jgi:hypothetical protein
LQSSKLRNSIELSRMAELLDSLYQAIRELLSGKLSRRQHRITAKCIKYKNKFSTEICDYCDRTPESQNNGARRNHPLCRNGWVNSFAQQRICTQQ